MAKTGDPPISAAERQEFCNLVEQAKSAVERQPGAPETFDVVAALDDWTSKFTERHSDLFSPEEKLHAPMREAATGHVLLSGPPPATVAEMLASIHERLRQSTEHAGSVPPATPPERPPLPPVTDAGGTLLRPGESNIITGSGAGFKHAEFQERLEPLTALLQVEPGLRIVRILRGENHPGSMRKEPYHVIEVELEGIIRQVWMCNETKQATFVSAIEPAGVEAYLDIANKQELVDVAGAERVEFREQTQWERDILALVKNTSTMNRLYFTRENVLADLTAWATARGKTVQELSTDKMHTTTLNCRSGEKMNVSTYCTRAASALGISGGLAATLRRLKEIAGLLAPLTQERNLQYYNNAKLVGEDLRRFAAAGGTTPENLTTHHVPVRITCANNEANVRLGQYIEAATIAFGDAENATDAQNMRAGTLRQLKRIAGISVPEIVPRNFAYYVNPAMVDHDLRAFVSALGLTSAGELNEDMLKNSVSITCANGESVQAGRYLTLAAVHLFNIRYDDVLQKDRKQVLRLLLDIAGYPVPANILLNAAYFTESVVQSDLGAFADAQKRTDIHTLNQKRLLQSRVRITTGEELSGQQYLGAAGIALGIIQQAKDVRLHVGEILKRLFSIAGSPIVVLEFPARDRAYYENPENIRHDLAAFARAQGVTSTAEINPKGGKKLVKARCANGEEVKLHTYVYQAAIQLGLATDSRDACKHIDEALHMLREKAEENS